MIDRFGHPSDFVRRTAIRRYKVQIGDGYFFHPISALVWRTGFRFGSWCVKSVDGTFQIFPTFIFQSSISTTKSTSPTQKHSNTKTASPPWDSCSSSRKDFTATSSSSITTSESISDSTPSHSFPIRRTHITFTMVPSSNLSATNQPHGS